METTNVLFFGDVVGQAGCDCLRENLPRLCRQYRPLVVIANGENSAEGNGITPHSAKCLWDSGVHVITTGNHGLRRREIYELLEKEDGLIRPANFHSSAPGAGWYFYDHPTFPLVVANFIGRVYMEPVESPFDAVDEMLKKVSCPNIIVDFHAEATAEKLSFGYHVDGRVSAVIGTHTHVPTADERILPHGTAYITDAGMCGGKDSILGVVKEKAISRMRTGLPTRFSNDTENIQLQGVVIGFTKGKAQSITRFCISRGGAVSL